MNFLFLDQNVFEILGLQNLDEEKRTRILAKMNEVVGEMVIIRVMDELPEEDKIGFNKLVESQAEKDKIDAFLSERINLEKIVLEEAVKFKEKLAKDMGELKKVLEKK